jgi:ribosome-binding factor A
MTRRVEKVSGLLRDEIASALQHEMHDPRIAHLVSVTRVQVSPDLRHARVYVSVLGDASAKQEAMAGLNAALPYLRRLMADRLGLRLVPEITFSLDESFEKGDRVLRLMDRLARETERGNER